MVCKMVSMEERNKGEVQRINEVYNIQYKGAGEVVVIIKKGENVNHEDFDDVKKIKPWIMDVIIKKGENVDHALF